MSSGLGVLVQDPSIAIGLEQWRSANSRKLEIPVEKVGCDNPRPTHTQICWPTKDIASANAIRLLIEKKILSDVYREYAGFTRPLVRDWGFTEQQVSQIIGNPERLMCVRRFEPATVPIRRSLPFFKYLASPLASYIVASFAGLIVLILLAAGQYVPVPLFVVATISFTFLGFAQREIKRVIRDADQSRAW